MTKEQFRNKYVGKAVHCDTEEKAQELLALAKSFGWTWRTGKNLIEETYWSRYQEDTCYVLHFDKLASFSYLDFYKLKGENVVKFESEEKKMKTKKVFDLGLFVENRKQRGKSLVEILGHIEAWALESHGLTEEEMNTKNKVTFNEWMKEVEVKPELSDKEIEVLKALKVLDFKWIARDKNNILFAYEAKPTRRSEFFFEAGRTTSLNQTLFNFITWEDEEPTNIDELLKLQ